jgi:predicted ATPase/class 3 adenylate cyclase
MGNELHRDMDNHPLPEIGSFGDFIGREKQLEEVDEKLKAHRLVTLVAPGGMGKTRLVLESIKKKGEATPDAEIAFVSLEMLTVKSDGAVLDALASGLKLNPSGEEDLRMALAKRFNDKTVLLVLDNCETAHNNVAALVAFLLNRCPNLRILATSQHELGLSGLEAVYHLPPLPVPDDHPTPLDNLESLESYKLFVARAQMADASWMPEVNSISFFRRILQLTDGIPLAIEIVAAQAPFLSLAQICEELGKTPLGNITEVDTFSSVKSERHRSMSRCFEWSFHHLSKTFPKDAEGFKRLGIFEGRFSEDAVTKVCEVATPQKLLAHLVRTSFVHPCLGTNPRRYYMLRLTRAFAQEKARADNIDQDLITRHVNYFFRLASPLNEEGNWEMAPLESPENDWPDLIAASDAASRIGNLQAVWHISRALSSFLQKHGLWSERERLNRAAVKAATEANYWPALERSLLDLGLILEAQGLWPEAAEQYQRSLYFADRNISPNLKHQAMALQRLGIVLTRMGDASGSERVSRDLSKVSRLLDQPKAKAFALDNEGKILESRGDLVGAEAKYREAYGFRESIGDMPGLAKSQEKLGVVITLQGNWNQAECELRQSLTYWTSQQDVRMQGILFHHLADLFRRRRRLPEALDYCTHSLRFRQNDPRGRAVTLTLLAKIYRADKLISKAIAALQESKDLCKTLGNVEGQTIALRAIGAMHIHQRRWNEALDALKECRQLQETSQRRDVIGLGLTLESIAQLYGQRGDWEQAQAAYAYSLRFSKEARRNVQAAGTMMSLGMMFAAQGKKDIALSTLDDAITSLESERSGKALLDEARKLRSRLDRNMREGVSWIQWRDAIFAKQSVFVRAKLYRERKARLWAKVASSYETLADNFIESGQQMEAALAFNELGSAYRHLGDFERSEKSIRQALAIFEEIALPLGLAASWHKLGDLFAEDHRWPDAENAYNQSIKLKVECSDDEGEAISQDALAVMLINVGRVVEAEQSANRSWEILSKSGSAQQKWYPLVLLLWVNAKKDDLDAARDIAARLNGAMRGNRKLEAVAGKLHEMADVGDWDGVKTWLEREGIGKLSEPVSSVEPNEPIHFPSKFEAIDQSADRQRNFDAFVLSAKSETTTKSFLEWAGGEQVTLAIVFTDVVGSIALGEEIRDEAMNEIRRAHFAQSRKLINQFLGLEIKTIGDSFIAAFRCMKEAWDYARALQQDTGNPKLKIRAGIHIGPMHVEEGDVFGGTVNFAARVVGAVKDAEIWLSERAKEDIVRLGAATHKQLKWERHEGLTLKGFSGKFTLWAVT